MIIRILLATVSVVALTIPALAEEVHVGFMAPPSGPATAYGKDILNGAELAVKEINGGVGSRTLDLEKGDDRGSPQDAANVALGYVSEKRSRR